MSDQTTKEMGTEPRTEPGLLDLSIEDLKPFLAAADRAELEQLLADEKSGKTRKGAIEAIVEAIAALPVAEPGLPTPPADQDPDVNDLEVAAADAEPLRFSLRSERAFDLVDAVRLRPMRLVFGSEDRELDELDRVVAQPADWSFDGARALFGREILIGGDAAKVQIRTVALIDMDDRVLGVCEVPGGLHVGGGKIGHFPASSLIF